MDDDKFLWTAFYMEFADRLLDYRTDRTELIQKIRKVYADIQMKLPKLEVDDAHFKDIDPFTVFGLFNKKITEQNRIKIIRGLAVEFNLITEIPKSFDGVPRVNNLFASFYGFESDRGEHDIDHLWEVFAAALALADEDTQERRDRFSDAYNRVLNQYGIRWNITMGLFWIRPYYFLSLDSRNREFLQEQGRMSAEVVEKIRKIKGNQVPQAAEYLALIDACKRELQSGQYLYQDFPSLSYYAWESTKQDESSASEEKSTKEQPGNSGVGDADVDTVHYWLYSPGAHAKNWGDFYQKGIAALGWHEIGDVMEFDDKKAISEELRKQLGGNSSYKNSAYALWQFVHEMKIGDILFVKSGHSEILGKGIVTSDYEYDESLGEYPHIRKVNWTHKGAWKVDDIFPVKTLTDITIYTGMLEKILALFESDEEEEEPQKPANSYPIYEEEDFLSEVYMNEKEYETLNDLLTYKKNVILQGAPGVGKTFVAKRLAYSRMGVKDVERVQMVQFHQSYSYEDFIMGFRPAAAGGFELRKGVFYNFCKTAMEDSEQEYFFVIDEINRGNLSKIFGELFMLIEKDKRGSKNRIQLLYEDELFYVPENVYIIGTMNTADRSLAMLDYALRRRFAFFDLQPGFLSNGFAAYQEELSDSRFDRLIETVVHLNEEIASDETLGEGFRIGHSYFCGLSAEDLEKGRLSNIVEYELIPLLKEYWFDNQEKVEEWSRRLRSAVL